MKIKFDFTEGEWKIDDYNEYDKFIIIPKPGIKIDNDDVDPKESKANAHLIACAPEMIKALIKYVKIQKDISDYLKSCRKEDIAEKLINKDILLIEKATDKKWQDLNNE